MKPVVVGKTVQRDFLHKYIFNYFPMPIIIVAFNTLSVPRHQLVHYFLVEEHPPHVLGDDFVVIFMTSPPPLNLSSVPQLSDSQTMSSPHYEVDGLTRPDQRSSTVKRAVWRLTLSCRRQPPRCRYSSSFVFDRQAKFF